MLPRRIAIVLSLAACTPHVNRDRGSDRDRDAEADASVDGMLDAPPIDGAPDAPDRVTLTLSQTNNSTIATEASIACGACYNTSNPCNNFYTEENAHYRVFDLAQHGITKPFRVSEVAFAVEQAAGVQAVYVKLGTYNGTPGTNLNTGTSDFAGLVTQLAATTTNVPPTPLGSPIMVSAPITADLPAGAKLIVEVLSPNRYGQSNVYFYLGASTGGESKPAYLRAPACGAGNATTMAGLGYPQAGLIIKVTGSHAWP